MLVVLLGNSGSGKTSLIKKLIKEFNIKRIITATSRQIRPLEVNGEDYIFLSKEDFEKKISDGEFVEYTVFSKNYYGSLKREVEKYLGKENAILALEKEGIKNLKNLYPGKVIGIYLDISKNTCLERMQMRNDSHLKIKDRLASFTDYEGLYDYKLNGEEPFDLVYANLLDLLKKILH